MLDELREGDWMSRSSRKSQKEIEQALNRLEQRLGRPRWSPKSRPSWAWPWTTISPCWARCAARSWSISRTSAAVTATMATTIWSGMWPTRAPTPLPCCATSACAPLVEAIKALPEREQYVMGMYYEHDMNLKEIAAVLGVTESRVCQLHSQAIARLRTKMRAH
jgi:RNA polymerase sigma factor for flagellar operon FliA